MTDKEKEEVVSLGGLHVVGTERHVSALYVEAYTAAPPFGVMLMYTHHDMQWHVSGLRSTSLHLVDVMIGQGVSSGYQQ